MITSFASLLRDWASQEQENFPSPGLFIVAISLYSMVENGFLHEMSSHHEMTRVCHTVKKYKNEIFCLEIQAKANNFMLIKADLNHVCNQTIHKHLPNVLPIDEWSSFFHWIPFCDQCFSRIILALLLFLFCFQRNWHRCH